MFFTFFHTYATMLTGGRLVVGKRFLNTKTKEVFLGDDIVKKVNEVLNTYIPYQKVMVVTTKNIKEKHKNYYETFLKELKVNHIEYVFSEKLNVNKKSTTNFLRAVAEEVAGIVVIGSGQLIELVKVVSYIKEIPYILIPTEKFEPQYLCKLAKVKVDGLMKFYKVNAPLAVLLDKNLTLKQKHSDILTTFCSVTSVAMQLLDDFMVGVCSGKTLLGKHYIALKNIIKSTLLLNSELYNYSETAILTLNQQALKMGLVLQSLDAKNIDSATLCANAVMKLDEKSRIPFAYYKVIHSLFLTNLYESFVLNLKANNFFLVNIKERLKVSSNVFFSKSVKTNLIQNLTQSEPLKLCCYQLKEYEGEILNEIYETRAMLQEAYTILKRMNLSFSYYIEKTLNEELLKKAICLAPDLSTTDNFLKVMCRFGVLDYNF